VIIGAGNLIREALWELDTIQDGKKHNTGSLPSLDNAEQPGCSDRIESITNLATSKTKLEPITQEQRWRTLFRRKRLYSRQAGVADYWAGLPDNLLQENVLEKKEAGILTVNFSDPPAHKQAII